MIVMPLFMTTALASFVAVLALEAERTSRRSLLTVGGMACYAGMLVVTLTRNVPLNNRLLELTQPECPARSSPSCARAGTAYTPHETC